MTSAEQSFYVTGGTLRHDAPCYVERKADRELFDHLSRGEFCYVLTSRQMGKSSLMVRTATRLRQAGFSIAVLDLTSIGQNVTADQWYSGLLDRVGSQIGLDDEFEDFWDANEQIGPLQRWVEAIREVALKCDPGDTTRWFHRDATAPAKESAATATDTSGPSRRRLIIFVDEIDAVRSLAFPTDEFFAAIRECYNRRAADPEFHQLTFCLLGVATPSDLIRDARITPFNIGYRVELSDFTPSEAVGLLAGFGRPAKEGTVLLKRILYWSNGHPYLTQMLCLYVARDTTLAGPAGVDRLCESLFLNSKSQDQDDNLLFVREWLLRSSVRREPLFDLFTRVQRGAKVAEDHFDPLQDVLRLSGITRVQDGQLRVRNRIYHRVFNPTWVIANNPSALQRQQRSVYRRGQLRGVLAAAALFASIAVLAATWTFFRKVGRGASGLLQTPVLAAANPGTGSELKWQPRDPKATADQIDLTSRYNAALTSRWHGPHIDNDLRELAPGLITLEGINFDVRGLVQLKLPRPDGMPFPAEARNILVGRAARRLHFLHGAAGGLDPAGARLGGYAVQFSDGQRWEVPIINRRHLADWWGNPADPEPPDDEATPVWVGANPAAQRNGRIVRLFLTTWTNPLPQLTIQSIDFRSEPARTGAPFLLGLTLEPPDAISRRQ